MRNLTIIALVSLVAACSANVQRADEPTVQMKDQAVRDIEAEADAKEKPPVETEPEEELNVEMFVLSGQEAILSESGLRVRMTSGGPSWEFEFDHHGRKGTARVTGQPLYLEGVVFGHLYVFTEFGESVQVTLRSDAPNDPMPPEDAFALARQERANRLGCDGAKERTVVQDNGTAVLSVLDDAGQEVCHIVIGRYTRAVVDL